MILARRRKAEGMMQKFGTRGLVRGTAVGVAAVNVAAGGLVYVTGKRESVD